MAEDLSICMHPSQKSEVEAIANSTVITQSAIPTAIAFDMINQPNGLI